MSWPGGSGSGDGMGRRAIVALLLVAVVAGCGARRPASYVVRPGDTLAGIGQRFGVPHAEIARANRLRNPNRIHPGQVLEIPDARHRRVRTAGAPAAPERERATSATRPRELVPLDLHWPVSGGIVSSPFGARGAGNHDGIDIRAPEGTPIHAAERGRVVFSGTRRGYGNTVVIRHPDGIKTVYAHNQSNWVKTGQAVGRGEVIATVGQTGRTTGANLHFEVRYQGVALDPMPHLRAAAGGRPVAIGEAAIER